MTIGTRVRVHAAAKVNLGLELLGKRPDGYHEIRSIMALVSLADEIRVVTSETNAVVMDRALGDESNLVAVARDRFVDVVPRMFPVSIEVTKHIPIAGGLGGASTDAAATLLALNALQPRDARLSAERMHAIAASLGSDVPFFLNGPVAIASGTGTTIERLPTLAHAWHLVLVSPAILLPHKTATLYGRIQPSDFTDGSRIDALAAMIRDTSLDDFDERLLANPFRAAWRRLGDPLAPFEDVMRRAGAPLVALSGAGPTLYTIFSNGDAAMDFADRVRDESAHPGAIHVAPLRTAGLSVEIDGAS